MSLLGDHVYAVILAGGSGTRFWPKSRQKSPKQLCKIGKSDKTMLEITLQRLDGFIRAENRIIVTHKDQVEATRAIAGKQVAKFLAEPDARNTANALALAAIEIKQHHTGPEKPIMISLHADHIIEDVSAFQDAIRTAMIPAQEGLLTLLGLVPSHPVTAYGYMEEGPKIADNVFKVASFREKPDMELAECYVNSQKFFWNAGIFIWRNDILIEELSERLPSTIKNLEDLLGQYKSFTEVDEKTMEATYKSLPKISIDHAVLEVSNRVALVKADIGWQDVGSWDALSECFATDKNGNFILGDALALESKNCTIDTDSYFVAVLGMENTVVACSKNAILVCPQNRAQDVKKIVGYLQDTHRDELI